jgi:DNA invertase Pin-like site-specific DNA recombinase
MIFLPRIWQGRIPCDARLSTFGFRARSDHGQSRARIAGGCRPHGLRDRQSLKDHGISGAKGRDKRPAFDALCRDATQRKFDMVMAWSVDRLGRSLQDLVAFLSELHALKVDLFLHQQGLDTTTPAGKAMFQMMGVFAEFERAMIQERVRAGLRRAKDEGKQLGRPPDLEERILAALRAPGRTEGVRKIAARFRVDPSTVQRISRPFDGAAPPAERSGLFLSGRLFHWNADVVPPLLPERSASSPHPMPQESFS